MTTATGEAPRTLRIGEVAARLETTTRTIRYYEELGLLDPAADRGQGKHRLYTEEEVDRLARVIELKRLLGLSLEELKDLVKAEEARAVLRARWQRSEDPDERRGIIVEALVHVDRQLELVRERRRELSRLDGELSAKRLSLKRRLRELDHGPSEDRADAEPVPSGQ